MHKYLRAIGFSKITSRTQLEDIYKLTLSEPNRRLSVTLNEMSSLTQFDKDFGDGIGLSLVGELDMNGSLSIEHYFPYVRPNNYLGIDGIDIEEHTYNKSYIGTIGDMYMAIMFYIQNIADTTRLLKYQKKDINTIMLSALSLEGTVILPIDRDSYKESYEESEDVLSVIDSTFLPMGIEVDYYRIIGYIQSVEKKVNTYTNELLYNITVESMGYKLNVCINALDLVGEPLPGRRFRGEVWLQGYVVI